MIDFPGVNGCAICDCGGTMFIVGMEGGDSLGNNYIRCLECVKCARKLAVPFFDDSRRTEFTAFVIGTIS